MREKLIFASTACAVEHYSRENSA